MDTVGFGWISLAHSLPFTIFLSSSCSWIILVKRNIKVRNFLQKKKKKKKTEKRDTPKIKGNLRVKIPASLQDMLSQRAGKMKI